MANIIPLEKIESKILLVRGQKVMLDRDLAVLYGVETKRLNEQVKRNIKRFPEDFMFQLIKMEAEFLEKEGIFNDSLGSQIVTLKNKSSKDLPNLKSQFVTSRGKDDEYSQNLKSQIATSSWGGRRKLPYVFTEQGVAMLSSVLRSKKAIEVNITIMRMFVKIRRMSQSYKDLARKIAEIEKKYNKKIIKIFKVLDYLTEEHKNSNKKEIGFK